MGLTDGTEVGVTDGEEVGFAEGIGVGLADGLTEGGGLAEGEGVGLVDGLAEGEGVGFSEQVPNCTSNPLEPVPALLTLNVIVVVTPSPVAVKDDNPKWLLFPLKEVIVLDDVPSETTTEVTLLSTEK